MQACAVPPKPPTGGSDPLSAALLAAELGEPFAYDRLTLAVVSELFDSMAELRISVPYATLNLLGHLAQDLRAEVREGVAQALAWLVDLYPDRVEQLLRKLALDGAREVRTAVAEPLADLLVSSPAPRDVVARWSRLPDLGRDVLAAARRALSASDGK
jgi:hypothetical protein